MNRFHVLFHNAVVCGLLISIPNMLLVFPPACRVLSMTKHALFMFLFVDIAEMDSLVQADYHLCLPRTPLIYS